MKQLLLRSSVRVTGQCLRQFPDFPRVALDGTVAGKETAVGGIEYAHGGPALDVRVGRRGPPLSLHEGRKVRRRQPRIVGTENTVDQRLEQPGFVSIE